jgi:CBS domain containing-hemolysin-like protein
MTPLLLFLLGGVATYLGTVTAAFSALMRLSLRIMAEGSGGDSRLPAYLEEPGRLFIPARLLMGTAIVLATALLARVTGVDQKGFPALVVSMLAFIVVCGHVLPLIIIRRDPERVLALLLPSFDTITRLLTPLTVALLRVGTSRRRERQQQAGEVAETGQEPTPPGTAQDGESAILQEGQAREMLRTLVDFRETMVREVMTPRPDIVAVPAEATVEELRTLFREQQYSRVPVFQGSLDNVLGFVFVKDLIQLPPDGDPHGPIIPLIRPSMFVPETKRVLELLRELQRNRLQVAVVVDEYGGTSGLVTLEDLIEEIVGEIRDEYDVEVEPVVDEGSGQFVFSGKAHVQELTNRLHVTPAGEGFETVGGFLLSRLGRVPAVGEQFDVDGLSVQVLEAERRRITRVRIALADQAAAATSSQAG